MNTSEKDSLLSRWSKRKHQVQQEDQAVLDEIQLEPEPQDELITLEPEEPEKEDINLLTDEDMPDVETLDESSDFTGFLSRNVSTALRKQALRKLFGAASYNVRDGMDDYDGNYTAFEKLDPSVITADIKHRLEMEAQKKLEAELEADENEVETAAKESTQQDNSSIDEATQPDEDLEISNDDLTLAENELTDQEHKA